MQFGEFSHRITSRRRKMCRQVNRLILRQRQTLVRSSFPLSRNERAAMSICSDIECILRAHCTCPCAQHVPLNTGKCKVLSAHGALIPYLLLRWIGRVIVWKVVIKLKPLMLSRSHTRVHSTRHQHEIPFDQAECGKLSAEFSHISMNFVFANSL